MIWVAACGLACKAQGCGQAVAGRPTQTLTGAPIPGLFPGGGGARRNGRPGQAGGGQESHSQAAGPACRRFSADTKEIRFSGSFFTPAPEKLRLENPAAAVWGSAADVIWTVELSSWVSSAG